MIYTTAVLRCDALRPCVRAIEGDSVADCRRTAKEHGWRRVQIEDVHGRRRVDICPDHLPSEATPNGRPS